MDGQMSFEIFLAPTWLLDRDGGISPHNSSHRDPFASQPAIRFFGSVCRNKRDITTRYLLPCSTKTFDCDGDRTFGIAGDYGSARISNSAETGRTTAIGEELGSRQQRSSGKSVDRDNSMRRERNDDQGIVEISEHICVRRDHVVDLILDAARKKQTGERSEIFHRFASPRRRGCRNFDELLNEAIHRLTKCEARSVDSSLKPGFL
jgi:hypothetical protein